MSKNNSLVVLTEGAIIVAAAQALSFVPHDLGVSSIQVEYGLIPMAIYALRRGVKPGLMAGFVWGILDLILKGFSSGGFLNPLQGLVEYPLAFAAVGLVGIGSLQVKSRIKDNKSALGLIIMYSALGFLVKYFLHFLAGGIYWGAYAPKTMNPWIYSLVINGGSFIANMIMMLVLLVVLSHVFKRFIIAKD
ncbi:energy-coupled thiamine transporter ThiT [Companilactobacillus allii]|uniref:Energy-coupled thiamine transporter ThiT n=1 Tax=Companilactobacillus allii TaxID=1847728 RepID=A0A1P8Q5G1_9LACO|nr:energy-coupled thiamine transporter ThiT [Companilactobacillus allii]APX73059.1 energy-coupled thiamine transporter ThiT [Companilactobacillus allii]USQ67859.1 energy-coupled thiamine transporter ThiT [Companilactobacillus allii]